jgi:hypothetical protein
MLTPQEKQIMFMTPKELEDENLRLLRVFEKILKVVDLQINDKSLWAEPVDRPRTIHEEIALRNLRWLHAVVEGDDEAAEFYRI